ncbi:2-trimethylaminoethylphosphonate dioxygenase [Luteipulveratus mongoliensis]|nr:TauD/TfdA family dioxygenase [Luteipulveratus mongoliensis]
MTVLDAPAIWLRDNCSCAECKHPDNGQKLFNIGDLADGIRVDETHEQDGEVHVRFAPDGHASVFDSAWLRRWLPEASEAPTDPRAEDAKQIWDVSDLGPLPEASWESYQRDPAVKAAALEAVVRTGFVVLRGVETTPRRVLDVAATFGFVRTTNYGDLFDVRIEPNPINLAFTGLPITPHTDNPYRDPVPTLQILHCLSNAAPGGDSGFVDGFKAAEVLRTESPDAFDILSGTEVTFRFVSEDTELSATRSMIDVDPYGRVREVRFNNRSLQPVRLRPEDTERFYVAYRAFAEVINRPEHQVVFRMQPGDCVIFDNIRLLHARTGFEGEAGERHLQGCYADLDGLESTLAVLRRAR